MNLNLTSVFNLPSLNDFSASHSQIVHVDKYVKIALVVSLILLIVFGGALLEYASVLLTFVILQYAFDFYKDLTSIDLHFSNEDLELNEIINELWN